MEEILCQYGCGRPGKVWDRRGDLPRCARKVSDCPVVAKEALRARKAAALRGRARPGAAPPKFRLW